jgi:pilus assembly protein Flp/PilA
MSKKPNSDRLRSVTGLMRRCLADDSGATAIEYALLASGVALAVAATVFSVGSELKSNFYDKIAGAF